MSAALITTPRLALREFTRDDAPFILELVNDPDWLRYIGDRGVRTLDDARDYLERGPIASYARHGFGLWAVARQESGSSEEPDSSGLIGMCGLIKRAELDDVDLGFAFLPRARGQGYAAEAGAAVLAHAKQSLGLRRVVAVTTQDNAASIATLRKLGFRFERLIAWPGEDVELNLFAWEA